MKFYYVLKRIIDIVVSFAGILVLIPLFLIIAIWVKSTSKGPIVYTHDRIGKNGKQFKVYKFRSMIVGAREQQKKGIPNEKLITSSGRFLRKTFFDETLQLFNVLKGNMSLVGPRPIDKETFSNLISKQLKRNKILKIKPGITSLEAVADYLPKKERNEFEEHFKGLLKKDINTEDYYKHRSVLDKYYIDNESFLLDAKLVFYTFLLMIKKIFSKK